NLHGRCVARIVPDATTRAGEIVPGSRIHKPACTGQFPCARSIRAGRRTPRTPRCSKNTRAKKRNECTVKLSEGKIHPQGQLGGILYPAIRSSCRRGVGGEREGDQSPLTPAPLPRGERGKKGYTSTAQVPSCIRRCGRRHGTRCRCRGA